MVMTYNWKKRLVTVITALILTLCHFDLILPTGVYAVAANGDQFLAFTSDVHNRSDNVSAVRLDAWIRTVKNLYGRIDYMGFCGDMADAYNSNMPADMYWSLAEPVMDTVRNNSLADRVCYTTGNHEHSPGNINAASTAIRNMFTMNGVPGNLPQGANYRIYCMGAMNNNQSGEGYPSEQIASLVSYLSGIGNSKPVFILSHFPLHCFGSRTTANASDVIDVLNAAAVGDADTAADDKTIVFLWGHNHTASDAYYDEIYEPGEYIDPVSGTSKKLEFYYAGAGCMSDSEYSTGSHSVKGKGLVVQITAQKKLGFAYIDANGMNRLENGPGMITGAETAGSPDDAAPTVGIVKKANPMTAKGRTIKVSASAGKTIVKKNKAFRVRNAKGTVIFTKIRGNKKITVSRKGKVTVKKGLKKGRKYIVKVKVRAAGTDRFLAKSRTVTLTIKVK